MSYKFDIDITTNYQIIYSHNLRHSRIIREFVLQVQSTRYFITQRVIKQ